MRASSRAVILLATLLLAVTGCADAGGAGDARVRYLEQPAVSCPPTAGLGSVRPQPLAADFAPVTAELCTFQLVIAAGPSGLPAGGAGGGWQWRTVRRSAGPFTNLLPALRSPGPISSPGAVCPSTAAAPLLLILADAAGHTAIPAIPATRCNRPHPAVQKALDAMAWTTVTARQDMVR